MATYARWNMPRGEQNPPTNSTADRELGQFDFKHSTIDFVDGSSLTNPSSVAVDRIATPQHLYIVDADNNRVLGYNNATAFANGAAADVVIGQPAFSPLPAMARPATSAHRLPRILCV
jgi:hypothetical protein